jgi:hypothetical protein
VKYKFDSLILTRDLSVSRKKNLIDADVGVQKAELFSAALMRVFATL